MPGHDTAGYEAGPLPSWENVWMGGFLILCLLGAARKLAGPAAELAGLRTLPGR